MLEEQLARSLLAVRGAWRQKDYARVAELAAQTLEPMRKLASRSPRLAANGLQLVAATRRIRPDKGVSLATGVLGALELYVEAISVADLEQLETLDYDEAGLALRAGCEATALGDVDKATWAFELAERCHEDFPARFASEALAVLAARRGDYVGALKKLGPLEHGDVMRADFPASLLFALGRFEEAATLWGRVPPPVHAMALAKQGWALFRAGHKKDALRKLKASLAARKWLGNQAPVEHAIELVSRPEASQFEASADETVFDSQWGEIERPESEEIMLTLFNGFPNLLLAATISALWRTAFGETVELAERLEEEAGERRGSGERHEQALLVPVLKEALAIRDAQLGSGHVQSIPLVLELFYRSHTDRSERAALGFRCLSAQASDPSIEELESACSVAEWLVVHLAEAGDTVQALTLGRAWLDRARATDARARELALAVGRIHASRHEVIETRAAFDLALSWLDPEDRNFEPTQLACKRAYAAALEHCGEDAKSLQREIKKTRRAWARAILKEHDLDPAARRVVTLLELYLVEWSRFAGAPFQVMEAVAVELGASFLRGAVNARPTHRRILQVTRAHASMTTFDGSLGNGVDVVSLTTKETPAVRRAFASADEQTPCDGGRMYFWWD